RLSSFDPPAPTPVYTLSLHDALPISPRAGKEAPKTRCVHYRGYGTGNPRSGVVTVARHARKRGLRTVSVTTCDSRDFPWDFRARSEEHTSELQSQSNLVCRLLLEKKK